MNYRLAVLTHDRMTTLDEAILSFKGHVYPQPVETMIYADGVWPGVQSQWAARRGALKRSSPVPYGFCRATSALWEWATEPGVDFVFWLEHDFLLRRDLDLDYLAAVLDGNPKLAQIALCRGPANAEEEAAGGLVASRPGEFEQRTAILNVSPSVRVPADTLVERRWLEHRSYFSTNPSLMRRDFMIENPFDDGDPFCEGRYGARLRENGFSFGIWGDGEPWVDHVGIRTGFGY